LPQISHITQLRNEEIQKRQPRITRIKRIEDKGLPQISQITQTGKR